jgi:hypothetical protein
MVLQCAAIIDHPALTVGEFVAKAQIVVQDCAYRRPQCCQFKKTETSVGPYFMSSFQQALLVSNKYGYSSLENNRDSARFELLFQLPFRHHTGD